MDPIDLNLHQKTGGIVDLDVRSHIQPRFIGIRDCLGHVSRQAGNHSARPYECGVPVHVSYPPAHTIHESIGGSLMRHAHRTPDTGKSLYGPMVGVLRLLSSGQVEDRCSHLRALPTGAILGILDRIVQMRGIGSDAENGVDTTFHERCDDIRTHTA